MGAKKISVEAIDVTIGYNPGGKRKIIHSEINLKLYEGEVTCLLGLNGAGKSTLLRTLCGFQPTLKGEVMLFGKPVSEYSQSEFARKVGVVLTEKTNAGGITVYELVSLGRHPYTGFFGQLTKNDKKIIYSSLEAAGIAHKSDNYVYELSDGERQKVMIAKVLAQECPVIILDEPTAFLDVTSRIETMALLRNLAHLQQKTVLLSTHDMDSAIQMGDCIWLLDKQKPVASGAPEDLIMDGTFEAFFGRDNISFDASTGKLTALNTSGKKIGIKGEFNTSYWVGNAIVRNGYKPSPVSEDYPSIICHDSKKIEIRYTDGTNKYFKSIADLCDHI